MNKVSRIIFVLALTTATVTLSSAAPARAVTAPVIQTGSYTCKVNLSAPNSVLIIGDSVTTKWMADTLAQFAAAGRPVCINAQSGRHTADAVYQLSRYKTGGYISSHTTVIMEVGSCDTYGAKDGYMRWQVDNAQRVLQIGTSYRQPLIWVDVLNWAASSGPAVQHAYGLGTWVVNLQLWQKDAQFGNLKVVRWNAAIRSDPHTYTYDLLHTTVAGNTLRNALIIQKLGVVAKV